MIRPVTVRTLPTYHIYVCFSDGAEGQVDLADFAGKELFAPLTGNFFRGFTLANIGSSDGMTTSNFVQTRSICG